MMTRGQNQKFDPSKHQRKSYRLQGYDYAQAGAYFVTIVARQRACLFGGIVNGKIILNALGRIADDCWRAIPEHFPHVKLGAHVIMPNHVHGIVIIHEPNVGAQHVGATHASPRRQRPCGPIPGSLGAIVGSFKSAVSKQIRREHGIFAIWQRNYHDRIIRNEREMKNIWRYIEFNPLNWAMDDENLDNPIPPGTEPR